MHRFTNVLLAISLAAGLAACGGGYSGFIIPIESDLKPWVEPETDELMSSDDDDEEEDYEEYEDGEDEDAAAPAKPAAAATPASKK